AVIAIQAALAQRMATDGGQHIDLSLFDVMTGTLANQAMNYLVSGVTPERLGNTHPNIAPYQTFETEDGWMILAIGNDVQFRKFCTAAGLDGLASDPRFGTNALRVGNRQELTRIIAEQLRTRRRDDLL